MVFNSDLQGIDLGPPLLEYICKGHPCAKGIEVAETVRRRRTSASSTYKLPRDACWVTARYCLRDVKGFPGDCLPLCAGGRWPGLWTTTVASASIQRRCSRVAPARLAHNSHDANSLMCDHSRVTRVHGL